MNTPAKVRKKLSMNKYTDKQQYLVDAAAFAQDVSEDMGEPEAEKLFCPAFKLKSCGCIQRFITGGDDEDFPSEASRERAISLLQLHREAQAHKNYISTDSREKGDKRVLRMLRAEGFEQFILEHRIHVRQEMGLCERASQKLLMYSNNFLHKDLKTGPEKGPRIKRLGGKRIPKVPLKPISSLPSESCCKEYCVSLAISKYDKLEGWRKNSLLNQQMLRKVVSEMLMFNDRKCLCHKFISLVTGCSFSLVSKVKELLKNKGHKIPSSRVSMSPAKQVQHDYSMQDDSLMDRSDTEGSYVIIEEEEDVDLSNSGINHSEVAALNGSHELYEEEDVVVVKEENVEDYQLDSSSISQYLQNRHELWNPLSIECPTVLGPSMVKVSASIESPPQTKTFTVLGPASTAPIAMNAVHSDHSVIFMADAMAGQPLSFLSADSMGEFSSGEPYPSLVILQQQHLQPTDHAAMYVHE